MVHGAPPPPGGAVATVCVLGVRTRVALPTPAAAAALLRAALAGEVCAGLGEQPPRQPAPKATPESRDAEAARLAAHTLSSVTRKAGYTLHTDPWTRSPGPETREPGPGLLHPEPVSPQTRESKPEQN